MFGALHWHRLAYLGREDAGGGITSFRSGQRSHSPGGRASTVCSPSAVRRPGRSRSRQPRTEEFARAIGRTVETTPEATFMIAGGGRFVSGTAAALLAAGVSNSRVRRDPYYLYRSNPDVGQAEIPARLPRSRPSQRDCL